MATTSRSYTIHRQTRHRGFLHISEESRYARVRFTGLPCDRSALIRAEVRREMSDTLCYPMSTAMLQPEDAGELIYCFDKSPRSYFRRLSLTHQIFQYAVVTIDREQRYMKIKDPILPRASWKDIIFWEGMSAYRSAVICPSFNLLTRRMLNRLLIDEWQRVFAYTNPAPTLNDETIERVVRLSLGTATPPDIFSKTNICGNYNDSTSIWSVFQTLIELVGRSRFLRKLHNSQQLHLMQKDEVVKITLPSTFTEEYVHYFFVSRRLYKDRAALGVRVLVVNKEDKSVERIQRCFRIAVDDLEHARGNPYTAFAHLNNYHTDVLKVLTPRGLLQPSLMKKKPLLDGAEQPRTIKVPDSPNDVPGYDCTWWTTSCLRDF